MTGFLLQAADSPYGGDMGLFSFVERYMRVPRGAHYSVQRGQPMPALPACGLKGTLERISE